MNRHASMNRIYRLVWSQLRRAWIPVAETARGRGKSGRARSAARARAATTAATAACALAFGPLAQAGPTPTGGQIVSGNGSITQSGNTTTIRQSSQDLSINWLSFNIAPQETVDFIQPDASAIAVNRIGGTSGSQILGHLDANGQVYLINPNGVLFGQGAQVNVGGLVASTLDVSDASLGAAARSFSGAGTGSVANEGTITAASGGYVVLIGNRVSNQGVITAQLGTVALGAGSAATLTFNGDALVHLEVDRSVLQSLAANGGLIAANGGQVVMTAGARDALLASVVNNTGVIEARTVESHEGTITLLGGMTAGTVNVGGTLDASAPEGGRGGFIDTSAAQVEVANDARVTTAASKGLTGSWLIDPNDFTVAPTGGDITGAALSSELGLSNITLESSAGAHAGTGTGSVNIDDTVSWSANTLTLTAADNVNVNGVMTATGSASLAMNPSIANGSEAAVTGGTVVMGLNRSGFTGQVNFSSTGSLSIDGTSYTVINSLGAAASTTGTDLQGMNGNLSGHYALGSNINAAATSTWNSGAGFTPVGNSTTSFTGTFDGLGHTISNLTLNQPSAMYVGLFGETGAAAVIRNVGVIGGSVAAGFYFAGGLVAYNGGTISNSYATGSVSASDYAGGLAGENVGSISNSHVGGLASASGQFGIGGLAGRNLGTISNSYAAGSVSGGSYVGGLVARNDGTISNSYATGSVSGTSEKYFGGLVAWNSGTISNSYATGSVSGNSYVGGLVGINVGGSVSNSYATGNVSQGELDAGYTGGLVGWNSGTISNSYATGSVSGTQNVGGLLGILSSGSLSDSYSTGKVSGSSYVGGLVGRSLGTTTDSYWNTQTSGQQTSAGGTGLTTAQMQVSSNFTGFVFTTTAGAAGNNWVMVDTDGSLNNAGSAAGATFPMLASEYSTTITNAHQLQLMAMNTAASYSLGTNINASGTGNGTDVWGSAGFVPIGNAATPFSGAFNGQGNAISGLTINLPTGTDVGLFAATGAAAVLQDVGLIGGSVSGSHNVGDLVGANAGAVSDVYATGRVSGSGTSVGGLAGSNARTTGTISDSYATGSVSGSSYVGGLVGFNAGTIGDSYAAGSVSGASDVGGLVGDPGKFASVSNSFWDVTTSGQTSSAGGIGMTTAQMQTQANFTSATAANGNVNPAWDFTNTWVLYDGHTYPLLRSFMTPLETWIGPVTGGLWSNAINWSSGIVPDDANVLAVTIPSGHTVTYDSGMASLGPTLLTSLQAGSGTFNLNMDAGLLDVTGNLATASFTQTGGLLDVGGSFTISSPKTAGAVTLGNIDAGSLSVTSKGGAITQLASTALEVAGTTTLTAESGATYYDITLADAGNRFSGTVTSTGSAITLDDDTALTAVLTSTGAASLSAAGAMNVSGTIGTNLTIATGGTNSTTTLGDTKVSKNLTVTSTGAISQGASSTLTVKGASTLSASGSSAITLTSTGDDFTGAVTASGDGISLYDALALTAVLSSTGNAAVQTAATTGKALKVSGTVAGSLTTTSAGGTVFGNTTVGPSSPAGTPVLLDIMSVHAVSVTSGDAVTVGGKPASTTVVNPYVEVNGKKDTKL